MPHRARYVLPMHPPWWSKSTPAFYQCNSSNNETKTFASRHLTLLYMRHVTFMLIVVEIQHDDKSGKKRTNERTNLKFRTRHIMFLMFVFGAHRRRCHFGGTWKTSGKRTGKGNCKLRYEEHFSALFPHDMQAKRKNSEKVGEKKEMLLKLEWNVLHDSAAV